MNEEYIKLIDRLLDKCPREIYVGKFISTVEVIYSYDNKSYSIFLNEHGIRLCLKYFSFGCEGYCIEINDVDERTLHKLKWKAEDWVDKVQEKKLYEFEEFVNLSFPSTNEFDALVESDNSSNE